MSELSHLRKMVVSLTKATEASSVPWKTNDGWTFFVTTPAGSIVLSSRDFDGSPPYSIAISDAEGVQLESFTPDQYMTEEEDELDDRLRELYGAARRSALNIDKTLKDIGNHLGLPEVD
jgi:hypothetical protein